jgi:arsenite oxidase large subunit
MLDTDGKFGTRNGRAQFKGAPWKGLLEPVAKQKQKYRFWINHGRLNEIGQRVYHTATSSSAARATRSPRSR